jgi:glycosyltransferase involved in cell wall biosynthesis
MRLHDIVDSDAFSRLNVWLLKTCARYLAARTLTVSNASEEKMAALGVPRAKLRTVYNGIDLEAGARPADRSGVRAEFGIEQGAPLAGLVGRLVDWKGPDCFIKAAAAVVKDLPDARFLLVGDAIFGEKSFVDELKEMCSELGVADKVIFTGFRDDISAIMRSIDLLVHASTLPEPFGMVLIEAMAERRPVVATRAGGVLEIVDDGVTGILVPPRDSTAMARAMAALLSAPDTARAMGEAGLERARRLFDIATTTRQMEEALLEALGNGGEGTR